MCFLIFYNQRYTKLLKDVKELKIHAKNALYKEKVITAKLDYLKYDDSLKKELIIHLNNIDKWKAEIDKNIVFEYNLITGYFGGESLGGE